MGLRAGLGWARSRVPSPACARGLSNEDLSPPVGALLATLPTLGKMARPRRVLVRSYVRNSGQVSGKTFGGLKRTTVQKNLAWCPQSGHSKFSAARREFWLFWQKEARSVRYINLRVSERKAAVLALQSPARHWTKLTAFTLNENPSNHLALLSFSTTRTA